MASIPGYVFTRDYVDNNRINLQHRIWVAIFGYLLHPVIPVSDKVRIADVGTGTAIWLTDLSSRISPAVQLDGLDISMDAAPPPEWLPSNVNLRYWDVKSEVPMDLVGQYDIVHIRNFLFVLLDSEVSSVLSNLVKLLKPGGYLQWGEPDMLSWRIETTKTENPTVALQKLRELSQPQDPRLSPTWIPRLPKLFQEAGLLTVVTEVKEASSSVALEMHECSLAVYEILARKSKNNEFIEGLRTLMPEVVEETRRGACFAFTRWSVVGRKPDADNERP